MKDIFEQVIISANDNLRHALTVIDFGALRIVLVVDESSKLLGTVTDGDIRRGLLRGLNMEDIASDVMNLSPTTASPSLSDQELIRLMEAKVLLAIPIVDNGTLIGLKTLQALLAIKKLDNPVFLMAGGFGTRLRPLTDNCPKPLLKIGEKPLLETTLLHLIRNGFHRFYISTHYLPQMITDHFGNGEKWNVVINYVHEESPLGTGGALGLLPKDIPQLPLIMMNGDVLTNLDFVKLLDFHNAEKVDATMCVREYEYQVPYGVVQGERNRVITMEEKPSHYFHVNTGIYVINPSVFNSVLENTYIDMPTLLEKRIENDGVVGMYPLFDYWLDIGRMEDFKRAQSDIHTLGLV